MPPSFSEITTVLNFEFFSSGLLYRVIALHNEKTNSFNLNEFEIISNDPVVCKVDGNVYEEENLYTPQINRKSSEIAQLSEIRILVSNVLKFLFDNSKTGLVVEGRDMGSVIFPSADLKIFLTASVKVRANRRYKELIARGENVSLRDLERRIALRDKGDRERKVSPLIAGEDAIVIDASEKSVNEVKKEIIHYFDLIPSV